MYDVRLVYNACQVVQPTAVLPVVAMATVLRKKVERSSEARRFHDVRRRSDVHRHAPIHHTALSTSYDRALLRGFCTGNFFIPE